MREGGTSGAKPVAHDVADEVSTMAGGVGVIAAQADFSDVLS